MVPVGNKAKRLSFVNHTKKTIHHHDHHNHHSGRVLTFLKNDHREIKLEASAILLSMYHQMHL